MKITIAGSGQTAEHLARTLSVEDQDVVVIDNDAQRLRELEADGNFITVAGDALDIDSLRRAGVADAAVFVAVTPSETLNITAAQLAKNLGAAATVARVDSASLVIPDTRKALLNTGVDSLIMPELLGAEEVARFLRHNGVSDWMSLFGGKLLIVGATLGNLSPLCGAPLANIAAAGATRRFHVVATEREGKVIIPRGKDSLHPGDHVFLAVIRQDIDELPALCGTKAVVPRRVMISGGGRVTEQLLKLMPHSCRPVVIEPDKERCRRLAASFPYAVVVRAASSEVEVLKQEGIENCDAFLALSGSPEANIVACMVARQHGVPKTVARIEELQFISEARSLAIDKIINKKLLNTAAVVRRMLEMETETSHCFALGYAEVVSLRISDRSPLAARQLRNVDMPRGVTVAGVIHGDNAEVASGNTIIMPGDRVVFFCVAGSIGKLRKLI